MSKTIKANKRSVVDKQTPNGLTSYTETFAEMFERVVCIRLGRDNTNDDWAPELDSICQRGGHYAIVELIQGWSIEFEQKNTDRDWDGEFFDEVNDFFNAKMKALCE